MPSKFDRHQYFSQYVNGVFVPDPLLNQVTPAALGPEPGTYMVVEEDLRDPTLISYKIYRTTSLWWLILMANEIIDPFKDLYLGRVLKIPPRDQALAVVNGLRTRDEAIQ